MASVNGKARLYVIFILGLLMHSDLAKSQDQCDIDPSYVGTWYSFDFDGGHLTSISSTRWGEYSCLASSVRPKESDATEGTDSTLIMQKEGGDGSGSDCYTCLVVQWRTPNVLQYHMSGCFPHEYSVEYMCDAILNSQRNEEAVTLFRADGPKTVECSTTFNGVYGFNLETPSGFCDTPDNILISCDDPGSSYVDNNVFSMAIGRCPNVGTPFEGHKRFLCLGSWYVTMSGLTYKFAAVEDTLERDNRKKYKCLMTDENQEQPDNSIRWVMSRFSRCDTLDSLYEAPYRLSLHRSITNSQDINAQCNLPSYMSGSWYTWTSELSINETHIHSFPKCTPGTQIAEAEDFYLSCHETVGTRFMMTKYAFGKCEVEWLCLDIEHEDGYRGVSYRVGKSYPPPTFEERFSQFLQEKFKDKVCGDHSFNGTNPLYILPLYR